MSIGITARDARLAAAPKYLGNSAPQRTLFVALISILAWTLAALLVAVIRLAHPPYPLSALFYFFVVFHLLPWAVGLRNLRRIRKNLTRGKLIRQQPNSRTAWFLGCLPTHTSFCVPARCWRCWPPSWGQYRCERQDHLAAGRPFGGGLLASVAFHREPWRPRARARCFASV